MNADKMPEDSTLRRHYESQLKMMGKTGGQSTHGASPKAASSSGSSRASSSSGGFFGWLKRLFGS
ncbi:MAG: hypothetical protein ACREVE_10145 [Gammaproteobacteria bacterium]